MIPRGTGLQMKALIKEFKEFISRGNVMDMAVGVIIGGAFTAIVNSLVNDMLMPLLSLLTGGFDFSDSALPSEKEKMQQRSIMVPLFRQLLISC